MREPPKASVLIVFVLLAIQWPNAAEFHCRVQAVALAIQASAMV